MCFGGLFARCQYVHPFVILHLKHLRDFLTHVTLDIIDFDILEHLIDLLLFLVVTNHHQLDHSLIVAPDGQMQSCLALVVLDQEIDLWDLSEQELQYVKSFLSDCIHEIGLTLSTNSG